MGNTTRGFFSILCTALRTELSMSLSLRSFSSSLHAKTMHAVATSFTSYSVSDFFV